MKMEKSEKGVKVVGFWVSPFVHRVKWGLKLKGVEYEYIEEDIFNRGPILAQLNPIYGKVPVLVHDGNPLPESAVILEYIDEVWPQYSPLLPLDAYPRSQARFWARFVDEKILRPTWIGLCSEGEEKERAVEVAIRYLEKMEEMVGGERFFGGERMGYLDLMMGFIAYMLPIWEEVSGVTIFDDVKYPNLAAWKNNFLHHPVIKTDLPSKAQMFTYFQRQREVRMRSI